MAEYSISEELSQTMIVEELVSWYREATTKDYDYIATMSRRCPNILASVIERNLGESNEFIKVLTDNGLLLKAKEIARTYNNSGVFPSIALLDDVLVHGRSLNSFLHNFFSLICVYLKGLGNQSDTADIQNDFYKKITIRIFAMNKAPVFLSPEYQWRIQYRYIWPEKKWRAFSKYISDYIGEKGIANTSYVISAQVKNAVPVSSQTKGFQEKNDVSYRGLSQKFYLYSLTDAQSVYPTVRSYKREGRLYYTPYVFLPTVDSNAVKRLLDLVFERISDDECNALEPLSAILKESYEQPLLHAIYGQLFTLVLSQISLSVLLSDLKIEIGDVLFDTYHIARNFGFISEIQSALDALCKIRWDRDFFEYLCAELTNMIFTMDWMCVPGQQGTLSDVQKSDLREAMENVVYEQAVIHESSAKEIEALYVSGVNVKNEIFGRTGEQKVDEFFKSVVSRAGQIGNDSEVTMVVFSLLTQMMDIGDLSLKMKTRDIDGKQFEIYSAVRNTEMSLSIMPRKMKPYFRDFSSIVQFYCRQVDFLEQVDYYFCDFLPEYTPQIREYADLARYFASIIKEKTHIVNSLLDWDGAF